MNQNSQHKARYPLSIRTIAATLAVVLFVTAVTATTYKEKNHGATNDIKFATVKTDSVESVKAFASVYQVLMSPRCLNCHPSGDVPLQGDDSHLHAMLPKRGVDGKGLYAMKCSNCHQPTNTPGLHTPPGNPEWHLPPAKAKMVFQGRTPYQLAKQLIDPKMNGGKTMDQLLAHAHDTLVVAGWHPGEGRTLPPMSHDAFTKAWTSWIKNGAYAPKQ